MGYYEFMLLDCFFASFFALFLVPELTYRMPNMRHHFEFFGKGKMCPFAE